jgi:hypothetical protein
MIHIDKYFLYYSYSFLLEFNRALNMYQFHLMIVKNMLKNSSILGWIVCYCSVQKQVHLNKKIKNSLFDRKRFKKNIGWCVYMYLSFLSCASFVYSVFVLSVIFQHTRNKKKHDECCIAYFYLSNIAHVTFSNNTLAEN